VTRSTVFLVADVKKGIYYILSNFHYVVCRATATGTRSPGNVHRQSRWLAGMCHYNGLQWLRRRRPHAIGQCSAGQCSASFRKMASACRLAVCNLAIGFPLFWN